MEMKQNYQMKSSGHHPKVKWEIAKKQNAVYYA